MRTLLISFVLACLGGVGCAAGGGSDGTGGSGGTTNPSGSGGAGTGGSSAGTGGASSGSGGASTGSGGIVGTGGQDVTGSGGADAAVASDGAMADASAGKGCQGVTAKFCDDWESQTAGAAPKGAFTVNAKGTGSVLVDTAQKFSGTKSLHIHSTGGATAMVSFTQQFPFNAEFGRFMIYNPVVIKTGNHWDVLQSDSGVGDHWEAGGTNGNFELTVDPPDNGLDSATPFPSGTAWHCVQWNFQDASYIVKVDGAFVKPTPVVNRWKNGTAWKNLIVGYQVFGGSPPTADYWIDDLAFGEQEIPCPTQ
ncbi:MAG TPA: hypothetical protein VNO55_01880 [Polyangia bacterium]|nr:hypothetical protein [Polyangia bacterium]